MVRALVWVMYYLCSWVVCHTLAVSESTQNVPGANLSSLQFLRRNEERSEPSYNADDACGIFLYSSRLLEKRYRHSFCLCGCESCWTGRRALKFGTGILHQEKIQTPSKRTHPPPETNQSSHVHPPYYVTQFAWTNTSILTQDRFVADRAVINFESFHRSTSLLIFPTQFLC